jgi:hypothetical protein
MINDRSVKQFTPPIQMRATPLSDISPHLCLVDKLHSLRIGKDHFSSIKSLALSFDV